MTTAQDWFVASTIALIISTILFVVCVVTDVTNAIQLIAWPLVIFGYYACYKGSQARWR